MLPLLLLLFGLPSCLALRDARTDPPHLVLLLFDDFGWADAGWHRNYSAPGGGFVPPTDEVHTPQLNALVAQGIELDRAYVYKYCSPSRSALQSGRSPYHVNPLNAEPNIANPDDPDSGFAGVPRNMTGIAAKLKTAGYTTAAFGKWDAGMATPEHTPRGRGYDHSLIYFHHANDYWAMSTVTECEALSVDDSFGAPRLKPTLASAKLRREFVVDLWIADAPAQALRNTNSSHAAPGLAHPSTAGLTENSQFSSWYGAPARGLNNTCIDSQPAGGVRRACMPGPQGDHWWGGYEDALFEQHVLAFIEAHDAATPMFLFWAPHIVHSPLQVPKPFLDKFDFMAATDQPQKTRQTYAAMVNYADTMVGNVTRLLKRKGMWDNLLFVFSTDNGGPIYYNGSAGANNYPLRGGKMNNFEGGIRGNAFVSGGFLPPSVRGTKFDGLVALWDWYATFAVLAGVDPTDHRAAAAGLPPIDSVDLSPVLLGKAGAYPRTLFVIGTEPRVSNLSTAPLCSSYDYRTKYYDDPLVQGDEPTPLPIAMQGALKPRCTTASGLIWDERKPASSDSPPGSSARGSLWKILTGTIEQDVYTGPHFPNRSTDFLSGRFVRHCGDGCLFDLEADPLEAIDVAHKQPQILKQMREMLERAEATAFNPHRGGVDPRACKRVHEAYAGFWGPFVEV